MKCGSYNLWKGRKVKIFSANKNEYLGAWEYLEAERIGTSIENNKRTILFTPKFKQGKKRIRGYECWWIPLNIAKKAEEGLNVKA